MDHRTDRLILHYVTEDDLAEVARTWPSDHRPVSEAETQGAISYMRGNYAKNTAGSIVHLCLAVCSAEEPGTIMGWCGLDGSKNHTEPEIFILLDEEYRNKGYGTQCVKELLRIAAEDYSLPGVHGGCDKDNILPDIERLDESQTWFAKTPSEEEFSGTSSEFWWVLKTFAEYTLRQELPSAMFYLNVSVRDLLNRMIRWYLFLHAGHPVDMGILDCNMEKLLKEDLFSLYKKTYPMADYEHIWEAFDAVVKLWITIGNDVAERCGYAYPADTEKNRLSLISTLRR